MILDTTFIIDLMKNRQDVLQKMQSLIKENTECGIATPTIFELFSGLTYLNKSENERKKIISLLESQIIYALDKNGAEEGGRIDGELMKIGFKIEPIDSMIAGIAIRNNKKILTRDKHFSRIDGLKVEGY